MKASELMTGNLVMVNKDGLCIPKGTIVRVEEVDSLNDFPEKGLVGSAHCVDVHWSAAGGIWCEYLSPIPLTPEILKKNKFTPYEEDPEDFHDESCVLIKQSSGGYAGCIDKDRTISGMFHYVHELQQAFRVCGIEKVIGV